MIIQNNQSAIKLFLFVSLLFLFLPSFYIPATNVPIYDIIIGLCIFLFLVLFPKYTMKTFKKFFQYNHYRVLWYFIIWVFFIGFIFIICGKYNILHFLYATVLLFFYNDILWYIYPSLIFPRFFSTKFIIKFLFLGIYIICIYGFLVYLFNSLGINILNYIQDIINNRREEIVTTRILSVFEEPSSMGSFLCLNLSMLYCLINSRYKIFKNSLLNKIIKKTYIPLLLITIIGIQSPIWLPFFLIITIVHFSKDIFKYIKRNYYKFIIILVIWLCSCIFIYALLSHINIKDTFLNRIVTVSESYTDWDKFVRSEPSLANRLLSNYFRYKIFLKQPLTGVGYKNTEYSLGDIVKDSKISFTKEMLFRIEDSQNRNGYIQINGFLLWILLSDTGLIGSLLFYLFLIYSIKKAQQLYRSSPNGIEKDFLSGIRNYYITMICLSIYVVGLNVIYNWFILGLINVFILRYNMKKRNLLKIKEKYTTNIQL